ncbi:hypothetical protein WwAna0193, partial [Wolbachia endosymbiont of Drosophila ananassae]
MIFSCTEEAFYSANKRSNNNKTCSQ